MKLDFQRLTALLAEDVAAFLDDPEAHRHTVRLNLHTETTYMAGEKSVDVKGRVKAITDPKEILAGVQKLMTVVEGLFATFISERPPEEPEEQEGGAEK